MGAIVPLIGIAPKTRLLPLVIFFCPCRKSTFIHPVLSPPRNRITPVNITVPPLSIFAAAALPSKPRYIFQVSPNSHPPAMELTLICFVEDAAYLIVSYDLFMHYKPKASQAMIFNIFSPENYIWPFLFFSFRTGNIFTRRYKQPKETNYRQIEKDILDEVMGPKVSCCFF